MLGVILLVFWMRVLKKLPTILTKQRQPVKKAEELAAKREAELAGSRQEATTILETAKETAEKNKAHILSEANQEALRLKEKAQLEISQNKEEAMNSIKGDVADLTVNLAGKLLSQQLDSEGHRQLIDRYLNELGDA